MMQAEPVRILLVDDHMVVRVGLAQVIGAIPGMTIVGQADSGEEALLLCHTRHPDIVLMDIRMQGMGGIGATEAIRRYHPRTRVIALSTYCDDHIVGQMMAAGASGFLPKTISADELSDAFRRVQRGEVVLHRDIGIAPGHRAGPVPGGETTVLGTQQRRALALLTKGYTNLEIAEYMGISMSTARYHVSAILVKLGVSNRAEAVAMAIRNKLVSDADF